MNNLSAGENQNNRLPQSGTGFDLRPKNMEEAMQIATMVSKSLLAPKDFRGKPEDTLVAMMLGNELGLNPMQAIQNIAVINGRPSIYGDALLALVQNHPTFESINESFDDASMTATCLVKRKGCNPATVSFSQTDASTAGLWGKQGPWTQYPKRMLQMRARGFALRDQFSDALSGLITREEAMDIPIKEINPSHAAPEEMAFEKPKADLLPEYDQKTFAKRLSKYVDMMNAGQSADEIIATLKTKFTLSEDQEKEIRSFENKGDSNADS